MRHTSSAILLLSILAGACGSSGGGEYAERMAQEHRGDKPVASGATAAATQVPVETSDVVYATIDGTEIRGYLARPAQPRPGIPGILVIQEWWGLNDNMRSMARQLAGEGYVALAVDLYEGRVAATPEEAKSLMSSALERRERVEENLRQGVHYLEQRAGAGKIGTIGWCFGGGWSLATALFMPDEIDAAVMYYGRLETDRERLAKLRASLLGLFGEADQGIPVDGVRAFQAALAELGKDAEIHIYPGAGHAFANPSGTRYVPEAAQDAWNKTLAFFAAKLGG